MLDVKEFFYINWGSIEFNNGLFKDEYCVMYWLKYKCWNDFNCISRLNYVCKKLFKENYIVFVLFIFVYV